MTNVGDIHNHTSEILTIQCSTKWPSVTIQASCIGVKEILNPLLRLLTNRYYVRIGPQTQCYGNIKGHKLSQSYNGIYIDKTSTFQEECIFVVSGEGFTWETQDRARDIAAAQAGWARAKELIRDPDIQFVLLDEINIALRYDYLDIDEVVSFLLTEKPPMTHVVLTGRNAKEELIEAADLVTEMSLLKHPFRDGIKAQKGIEF